MGGQGGGGPAKFAKNLCGSPFNKNQHKPYKIHSDYYLTKFDPDFANSTVVYFECS
jgi:hypothetical protein